MLVKSVLLRCPAMDVAGMCTCTGTTLPLVLPVVKEVLAKRQTKASMSNQDHHGGDIQYHGNSIAFRRLWLLSGATGHLEAFNQHRYFGIQEERCM